MLIINSRTQEGTRPWNSAFLNLTLLCETARPALTTKPHIPLWPVTLHSRLEPAAATWPSQLAKGTWEADISLFSHCTTEYVYPTPCKTVSVSFKYLHCSPTSSRGTVGSKERFAVSMQCSGAGTMPVIYKLLNKENTYATTLQNIGTWWNTGPEIDAAWHK